MQQGEIKRKLEDHEIDFVTYAILTMLTDDYYDSKTKYKKMKEFVSLIVIKEHANVATQLLLQKDNYRLINCFKDKLEAIVLMQQLV